MTPPKEPIGRTGVAEPPHKNVGVRPTSPLKIEKPKRAIIPPEPSMPERNGVKIEVRSPDEAIKRLEIEERERGREREFKPFRDLYHSHRGAFIRAYEELASRHGENDALAVYRNIYQGLKMLAGSEVELGALEAFIGRGKIMVLWQIRVGLSLDSISSSSIRELTAQREFQFSALEVLRSILADESRPADEISKIAETLSDRTALQRFIDGLQYIFRAYQERIKKIEKEAQEEKTVAALIEKRKALLREMLDKFDADRIIEIGKASRLAYEKIPEKETITYEEFLKRAFEGLDQIAMTDKQRLPLPEARVSVMDDLHNCSPEKKTEFFSIAFRWGRSIKRFSDLPETTLSKNARIDLNVYLKNSFMGIRDQILAFFDGPKALEYFGIGYRELIEKSKTDFNGFMQQELRISAKFRNYPTPVETIIAAGRLFDETKTAIETGDEKSLSEIIGLHPKLTPISLLPENISQIAEDAILETGPAAVRLLLSIYARANNAAINNVIQQRILQIGEFHSKSVALMLINSLMFKAAASQSYALEARLLPQLKDSISLLLDIYANTRPRWLDGRFARVLKPFLSKALQAKIMALEKLISEMLANTKTHPAAIDLLKSLTSLNLSAKIIGSLFNHFSHSSPLTAEETEMESSTPLDKVENLTTEVKKLVKDNSAPPSGNARAIAAYQKNVLTLALKILSFEDLVREGKYVEAEKERRRILEIAAAANLRISHAHLLTGFIYAGILLSASDKSEAISESIGNPETAKSTAASLKKIVRVLEGEIYTAVGKDYKELDRAGLKSEIFLYGIIMRWVDARRLKAAKIIAVLKSDEEIWAALIKELENDNFDRVEEAIGYFIKGARILAGILPFAGRVPREVKNPFDFQILGKALEQTKAEIISIILPGVNRKLSLDS